MRTEAEILADAKPGAMFSNGTEWEIWQFNACMGGSYEPRLQCVHDLSIDHDIGCPLILASLAEVTPKEWTARRCTQRLSVAARDAAQRKQERQQERDEQRRDVEQAHGGGLFEIGGTTT